MHEPWLHINSTPQIANGHNWLEFSRWQEEGKKQIGEVKNRIRLADLWTGPSLLVSDSWGYLYTYIWRMYISLYLLIMCLYPSNSYVLDVQYY